MEVLVLEVLVFEVLVVEVLAGDVRAKPSPTEFILFRHKDFWTYRDSMF